MQTYMAGYQYPVYQVKQFRKLEAQFGAVNSGGQASP